MLHAGKFPNEQIQSCSAQPSSLTLLSPPLPISCHSLPALLPMAPRLPTQRLCSCRKVRKQLETSSETFPYSTVPCCHTLAVSSKLTEQQCVCLICRRRAGHSSILHHSLQWGQSSSSGGRQALRDSQSLKASLNAHVKDLVVVRYLLVQRYTRDHLLVQYRITVKSRTWTWVKSTYFSSC